MARIRKKSRKSLILRLHKDCAFVILMLQKTDKINSFRSFYEKCNQIGDYVAYSNTSRAITFRSQQR